VDDFLHHLIVVAAFATAALLAKLVVWALAMAGSVDASHGLSSAFQLSAGLAAAAVAHYRARSRTAASLARPRS
jgi:hypothetical protein